MRVIGIDPSLTASGLVALDFHGEIVGQAIVGSTPLGPSPAQRMERFHHAIDEIMNFVNNNDPKIVCIETYSFGSSSSALSQICEFGGILRYRLWKRSTTVFEVAPSTLKKWASGKGGGDKTASIAGIVSRYGVMFDSNDLYDAYALARIAMQVAKCEEPANLPQREAIATVIKPKVKTIKKKRKAVTNVYPD